MQKDGFNPKQKKKNKFLGQPIFKRMLQVFFVCFVMILIVSVASLGFGAGLVSAIAKDEKIRNKEDFDEKLQGWSQTSYAYFGAPEGKEPERIGAMITELDRQLLTDLDQVNPYFIKAFLSVEDREFYQHKGIVPRSLLRATYQQISGSEETSGGSTLTQQLVKLEVLKDSTQSYERKALEIINAIRIEKYYNKEEIFLSYLNGVFFGKGAHNKNMSGVSAAAKGIFNKSQDELNLAQAAYIAGMVQRPNGYNPFRGEENLKVGLERMKEVLDKMLLQKAITQQEYNEAIAFDLKGSLATSDQFTNAYNEYPFIVTAVEREAMKILREKDKGNPEAKDKTTKDYQKQVRQGGFHIYTTVDRQLYDEMNNSLKGLHYPSKKIRGKMVQEQVGAVLIDNKTGAVLSFFAGTDFAKDEMDHAFEATNQPGSTIKPLLVYGPALNEGLISPGSILIDEPVQKTGTNKYYKNSGGGEYGAISATDSLKKSLNRTTVKLFRQLGFEKGFDYLRQMDLPPHKNDWEAAALGGMYNGYTVDKVTAAFAMIGNNGVYNKPHLIDRITDADGKEIYNFHEANKPKQVFSPQASYSLSQMLRQVVISGTAAGSIGPSVGGYTVAGKTGTTSNEWDLWFVGYTPEVSLGVWSGFDYNAKGSKNLAKTAWVKLFKAAAKTRPDLIKKGTQFDSSRGEVEHKCFECDKVPPPPPAGDGDGEQQPQQQQAPQQTEQPPTTGEQPPQQTEQPPTTGEQQPNPTQ
ncbi:transglycosylase domain-containing protein [Hazenella coriacea]|uniref:Penicillin-binding protein n=1 Tax=Hazenella coriacea TaxID=1179467 RepID=A0A4R3L5I6_9BACL|nr:transglycosylase domain-containing protein [Hazenella coriacea]TCS95061.1 penicillin-binding protein [Hazenella coriacea]